MGVLSKCCRVSYVAILTNEGKWFLRCRKCGKIYAILEEYNIDPELFKF